MVRERDKRKGFVEIGCLVIQSVETGVTFGSAVTWRKVLDFLILTYPGDIEELVAKVVRLSQSEGVQTTPRGLQDR